MDSDFKIRPMTFRDFELAVSWINSDRGNVSLTDAKSFFDTDPTGFFVGELNGEPISVMTGVKYSTYAHMGFYFVKPEYRKQGYGLKTFKYAMETVKDIPALGIDSVPTQVSNYEKSGFNKHDKVYRYGRTAQGTLSTDLIDLRTVPIEQIIEYDQPIFGGNNRTPYIESVLKHEKYYGAGKFVEGKLVGYGILRKTNIEYRIGPLVADSKEIAEEIMSSLQSRVEGELVVIDVFESNKDGMKIAEEQGWNQILTADRMYSKTVPNFNTAKLYSILFQIG